MINVIFAGTPAFAVPCLDTLLDHPQVSVPVVLTQPDRRSGRGLQHQASPVKQRALSHDISCLQPLTLKEKLIQQQLVDFKPDLMVVVAYGLLLPRGVLSIPKWGCWNVHASLLPRYRGAAPIQAALLNGDDETGVSVMQMDQGLDTGDVLCQGHIAIKPLDNATTLHCSLAELGAKVLKDCINQLLTEGRPPKSQPQDSHCATHQGKIHKAQARLDWSSDALTLSHRVRAYHGWPVAFTVLDTQRVRIWQAEVLTHSETTTPAGTIVGVSEQGLDIACGQGVLRVTQLQLSGGKCLPWSALSRSQSHGLLLGQRFS